MHVVAKEHAEQQQGQPGRKDEGEADDVVEHEAVLKGRYLHE
jgi:hypothetical protein